VEIVELARMENQEAATAAEVVPPEVATG